MSGLGRISQRRRPVRSLMVAVAGLAMLAAQGAAAQGSGGSQAVPSGRIVIRMEYALIDRDLRTKKVAGMLAPMGAKGAKHYPEHLEWNEMQKGPNLPIDFRRLDQFVREFQAAGFEDLTVCLRSHSSWASKQWARLGARNPTPKPQFMEHYARWIGAVVERYDGDGVADMPGLKRLVRYYEIGSEWSTYEPEPPEEYLPMLDRAYKAAHAAFAGVLVGHAAFLTTNAFDSNPGAGQYEAAFAAVDKRIMAQSLATMRKILDRGDLFDFVNIHSLGQPSEIDALVEWLEWEMRQRGYRKPIVISDTATTPFIAWGPATICNQRPNAMGLLVRPTTEADRCRAAAYFTKLVAGDEATVRWTQGFSAVDIVQRVVVAASRGVALINTAFIEDLMWFKLPIMRVGTGTSSWAGLVDPDRNEYRAGFYALEQVSRHLAGYRTIRRVESGNARVRLYELENEDSSRSWIAWAEPGRLILPGDPIPTETLRLPTADRGLVAETTITEWRTTAPTQTPLATSAGSVTVQLTSAPVFLYRAR